MKIAVATVAALLLAAAPLSEAQQGGAQPAAQPKADAPAQMPPACQPGLKGKVNFAACLDAAPAGSGVRVYALMNLGTEAYLRSDYAEAVRFYDEAAPPGQTIISDVYFHAFRAGAYAHVGRGQEAYDNARLALEILGGKPGLPPEVTRITGDRQPIYISILPILKKAGDTDYPAALAAYLALPARSWVDWSNRAGTLVEIGEPAAATQASLEALKLNATHPAVLNNHCYVLTEAGHPADALPFCEQAVQAAPDVAAVRHSLAAALAGVGRCADADKALAEARRLDPASATYAQPLVCKSP